MDKRVILKYLFPSLEQIEQIIEIKTEHQKVCNKFPYFSIDYAVLSVRCSCGWSSFIELID